MSETIVIPAVKNVFPSSDGSDSAQKLLRTVLAALNQFGRENDNSLLNCCEVRCSEFPLNNIEFVAAKLKEQGYHARLKRWYWHADPSDMGDHGCWCLTFQISSVPFPPAKSVRWWQWPFYIFFRRTTYTVY